MKSILHSVDTLSRLPLFTVLGLAIFLGGCSYSYTHTSEMGSSSMVLREDIKLKWTTLGGFKQYTGPQNAPELIKTLDEDYNRGHSKTEVSVYRKIDGINTTSHTSKLTISEIDARYPRAEWLQTLLDRGITIGNIHDYSQYLLKRHTLALLEDNPNLRQSGILSIPPTDDWETYKAAYIDKLVTDYIKARKS